MAMQKKLFKVDMIVDHSILHELMMLADGKSFEVNIRPVKHGGADEKGEPKSAMSGPQFVQSYAMEHPSFTTKEIIAASEGLNLTKATIYAALGAMKVKKVLKSANTGAYEVTGKAMPPLGAGRRIKSKGAGVPKPKPGERTADRILGILKQQDRDEGVSVKLIKQKLNEQGRAPTGVSPVLTALVRNKAIKRVGDGVYRVNG